MATQVGDLIFITGKQQSTFRLCFEFFYLRTISISYIFLYSLFQYTVSTRKVFLEVRTCAKIYNLSFIYNDQLCQFVK